MKKFIFIFFVLWAAHVGYAEEPNVLTAVSDVAQKTGPTVVSIKTEKTLRYKNQSSYFGNPYDEELFNQFFEDFFGGSAEPSEKAMGLGSGVIIDPQGYILTNDHVVDGADKITATLPDGRKFDAVLVGVDSRSDLAVIKISAKEGETLPQIPVAQLGNSENLKIGQWVVAIGNPFGNILDDPQPTVTSGVISALHRTLPQTSRFDTDYSDLIQTDAAINPGNSGGPLVNLNGEVIGINVAIFSTSGGYQGVGFAIPINYAKAIVEQLIQGKKIEYGFIGVSIQDIDERLAQYFDLTPGEGVMVTKVIPGAPAEGAGIKEGDIILSINKIKVRNSSGLVKQISNAAIGKAVNLQILRDNKTIELAVTVGQRTPDNSEISKSVAAPQTKVDVTKAWRGLTVKEITPDIAKQLALANTNGVVVTDIEKGSSGHISGLQKGDAIIAINKKPIRNLQDYNAAIQSASGSCLIRTVRGFFVLEP